VADDSMSTPDGSASISAKISAEHRAFLSAQAVDPDLAERLGVRSLLSRADVAEMTEGHWSNWANYPALIFPWVNEAGHVEYQIRPDNPTTGLGKKPRKYVFRKDSVSVLWAARPAEHSSPMLIVEGTKQTLAAASWAPPQWGVYGIAGCRMWQDGENGPIPDLAVAAGRKVVILLDADAATNLEVYDAGIQLAEALTLEGAAKVSFAVLPVKGKSGLDDVLGKRPPNGRTDWLGKVLDSAKGKPAVTKPKRRDPGVPEDEDGRAVLVINDDRHKVINMLTQLMVSKMDGVELFNHGGVISRRIGEKMKPVDRGSFNDVVQETCQTVRKVEGAQGTNYIYDWPDASVMSAVMSRAHHFSQLDRISHAPFVRPDGSIVTSPGYDKATRTMLINDPTFKDFEVPEAPTGEEVDAARELIMTEWLGDFPFGSDADRANMLALVLTPALRGLMTRAPMAVLDGLQMGVGKNKIADTLMIVYTGQAAKPMAFVEDQDEQRTQITSAFRTGSEFFVFDEAHRIGGASLAQALTAETWQDRILGVSNMADFPNRVTWLALGNNVQIIGDVVRRVYRIGIRPTGANPEDRPADTFRHPGTSGLELEEWVAVNRRRLLLAILTLIRAWYAAEKPRPPKSVSFGSFETWERIVGGVVHHAGLTGFLGNVTAWRSESDFDTGYWTNHVHWLRETFGNEPFKASDVRTKALTVGTDVYPAPPRLDDPADKAYTKQLGEAYAKIRGRRYGPLHVDKIATAAGHVALWKVYDINDLTPPPAAPEPGPTPDDDPPPWNDDGDGKDLSEEAEYLIDTPAGPEETPAQDATVEPVKTDTDLVIKGDKISGIILDETVPANVVVFDLETGDADDLYRTPGHQYIRIGGTARDDEPIVVHADNTVAGDVAAVLSSAQVVTGHNIMAFDLPAMVRGGTVSMPQVHRMAAEGRIFDTLLAARHLDPPMARDKGVDAERRHDLASIAERLELGTKLTDVSKPLAKKYGGWGGIPIDVNDPDPERAADAREFRGYLIRDVELSRKLYQHQTTELGKLPANSRAYLDREHRVAAIAAQIQANGFRVDVPELERRVADVQGRKADAVEMLHAKHGFPLNDPKGKPYASPLTSGGGKARLKELLLSSGVPDKAIWKTEKTGQIQVSGDHMLHLGREYGHVSPTVMEIVKAVYRVVSARGVYETAAKYLMPDSRVHTSISMSQASGRWSVTKPGLTVFGKRGGRHVEREVFLPEEGEVIISADLSQVDMRAIAGLSGDEAYISMLDSEDPHTEIALALFGDAGRREDAKAIGHGWNYGESLRRISESSDIDPKIVVQFDRSMKERFPRLVEWREEVRAIGASGALLDNGFGRPMRPDPSRSHTQSPALMGQGCARDLMMEGLLRLPSELLPMLRGVVHDEVLLSVPVKDVEEVGRTVVDCLSLGGERWNGVAIMADVSKPGHNWGACYAKG
jgi:DNA polymerase I-like protein with 3'-5' exonuclease and polymerase domains